MTLTGKETLPMKALVIGAALMSLLLALTACSVGMALSGKEEPNLGAFRVGSPRGEVQLQLGSPLSSVTNPDGGRTDIYEYELGNKPSAGRAAGHAVLDVLTIGLWEVVGTPIEAFQGETRRLAITYDRHDRVLAINQATVLSSAEGETGGAPPATPAEQVVPSATHADQQRERIDRNNKNVLRLQQGMSREEVHTAMGDPEGSEGYGWGTVWFYRTAKSAGGSQESPDTDFTPIIFNDKSILIGWGRNALAAQRQR
jgi:outer membrane protein assembly factor BamE (lipoprotein component of BamABCDE complex)